MILPVDGYSFVFDVYLYLNPDAAPRSVLRSVWRYIEGRLTFKRRIKSVCHLQALLGAHHILHVFRIGVKLRLFSKSQKIQWNINNIDNQLDATITTY